jgi:hypothetical protein
MSEGTHEKATAGDCEAFLEEIERQDFRAHPQQWLAGA